MKRTISFLAHHSSVVAILPLAAYYLNPVSLPFNLFQSTQSFFSASHLCLYFTLGYSFPVLFSKVVIIFSQPFSKVLRFTLI